MNILLDYFFPITAISATPAASTAFLKQVCVVAKPASGVTIVVPTLCTTPAEVAALTDNTEALELFNAGLTRLYILPSADLDLATAMASSGSQFFTVLVSSDYTDAEVTGIDVGVYKGVVGSSSDDKVHLKTQAIIENRVAFFAHTDNKAKNLMYAFGKLLSNNLSWANQQYITMPFGDQVNVLGDANVLFDDRISFVLDDAEFGKRLGLLTAGGKAITAPYIEKNLEIDLQSSALTYISGNQPDYSATQGALLEDELQKVIDAYIVKLWLTAGNIEIKLEQSNFVASGYINIAEPKALWRIFGEIKQTL